MCFWGGYSAPQVAVLKPDTKALEPGTWVEAEEGAQAVSLQSQKVVTFHVAENGETLVQEAFEASVGEAGGGEITQIAISAYEESGDFSVVEQAAEEIHSTDPSYRYHWPVHLVHSCAFSLHYS